MSVSLDRTDVEFLDGETSRARFASRSAGVAAGIRLLREQALADSYAEAFAEWADSAAADLWDATSGDGLA
ncbi:MAG: ribbon-helix-helix domain-containing protein [Propionibacteriaceae bacterium]|nr:ribbon-helix-helix domain-containing protein [Propionibacteriaceae bacterium]